MKRIFKYMHFACSSFPGLLKQIIKRFMRMLESRNCYSPFSNLPVEIEKVNRPEKYRLAKIAKLSINKL